MELSPQAEQILARAIVEYFGKRKDTPLMKGVTTIDDIAELNAASIHKMNADPVRRSDDYRQMQGRVALADAIEVAMAKGSMPHVQLTQPEPRGGDGDDDEPMSKKIARLMKERGWGIGKFDLAASEVLRGLGLHGEGYGKPVHAKPGSRPLSR